MKTTISVVIPACNEEQFISRAIYSAVTSAKEVADCELEIIVVINRCTDNTEAIAQSLGAQTVHCEEKNLSAIRNAGINASKGEIVITIDADSIMSPHMISDVVKALRNPGIVGGGCMIWPERWSVGIFLTALFVAPFVLFERISAGLFFFRRIDFDQIGGFDVRYLSAEDIDFARRLKKLGKNSKRKFITLYRSSITTSCRKFDRFGDWYFLKNPMMLLRLLKGNDRRYADLIWYDFHKK